MRDERRGGFGSFIGTIIVIAILAAAGYVGYKTYQKLPVITFVDGMAQAASNMDMGKLSDCFTPGSDTQKALSTANAIENIPLLGNLAQGAASFIGSKLDYQIDYSDVRLTVNGDTGTAIVGVIDKNNNGQKSYVIINLEKSGGRWYAATLPDIQANADLSYKNTINGYAEHASDYAALLIFSLQKGQ